MLYNPFYDMERLSSWLDDIIIGSFSRNRDHEIELANLYQKDNGYMFQFLAPGVKLEDVSIDFENGILTVHMKRNTEPGKKEDGIIRRERLAFDYTRSYRLSGDVDPDKIEAKIIDGLLMIHVAKKEAAKPKKIAITVH